MVGAWGISDVRKHIGSMHALYAVECGPVALELVNDRGCIEILIRLGPSEDHFMGVPTFMEILDHIGKKPSTIGLGVRRYSLKEQCDMLIERKTEIFEIQKPRYDDERRALFKRICEAHTAQFTNRANKAPEPTTMAVTSRAPSSTSRASHGRGSS